MRITDSFETLVHTHFVTDGERLGESSVRSILDGVREQLTALQIVFGAHLEEPRRGEGIQVVLECRPGLRELERIRQRLEALLRPIPIRPPAVRVQTEGAGPAGGKSLVGESSGR